MSERALVCLLAAGFSACAAPHVAPHSTPENTTAVSTPAPAPADVVQRLALLALGEPIDASRAQELALTLAADPSAVVDALLTDPKFAHETAPNMLLGAYNTPPHFGQSDIRVLHEFIAADHKATLTLNDPCTAAETVRVRPWWSPDEEVRVCSTSYRPEALPITSAVDCSGGFVNLTVCGCGPNLMWCMRDQAQYDSLYKALLDESRETIAYSVAEHKPVEWIFTTPDSVRVPLADVEYARSALACGAIKKWPKEANPATTPPQLRKRLACIPDQHAGILTTTHLVHWVEGTRQRQMTMADILFCIEPRSTNTDLGSILALGSPNFRDGDGWKQLAAAPGCTKCHARMDTSLQFFNGYPRAIDSTVFKPSLVSQTPGPLYFRDIHDQRGSAPLNPHEFAQLAVAQPEFGSCMVRRVLDRVFGKEAGPVELNAVRDAFTSTHELGPMMRAALVRYATTMSHPDSHADPSTAVVSAPTAIQHDNGTPMKTDDHASVTPSPAARELLERACVPCHDKGARNLATPTLSRALALDSLVQVGTRLMPKGEPAALAPADRRKLIEALVSSLFSRREDRVRALRQFVTDMNGSNVVTVGITLHELDAAAHGASTTQAPLEDTISPDDVHYSVDVIAQQAEKAALDCRQRGGTDAQVEACIAALWQQRPALTSTVQSSSPAQ